MKKVLILAVLLALPIVIPSGTQASTKVQVKSFLQVKASVTCPNGALHCASISWSAPTSGSTPTGYNVYRTQTSGGCATVTTAGCTKVTTSPVTGTSLIDSPLSASTTYFYVATAVNAAGESAPSAQGSATTSSDPVPNPPTGVTVTAQ